MRRLAQSVRIESRWPAALAVLAVLLLLATLHGRISLFPVWVSCVLVVVTLTPMVGAALTGKEWWVSLERTTTMIVFLLLGVGNVANLANLTSVMVHRAHEASGLELLASSIAVWATNVLAFSLLYWQLDRGGHGARDIDENIRPDWLFSQTNVPQHAPPGWRPTFVDYLFLSFSTATAFSATEALPLTSRAKMLMMVESSISLVTIVVVASRAINILGG